MESKGMRSICCSLRCRRPRHRNNGFTLIETLIAVAIGSFVIAVAVSLQRTVVRAGESLSSGETDWTAEQFVRRQFWESDETLAQKFSLKDGDTDHFSFVTHRSARFGMNGAPVLATYYYDQRDRVLRYRETTLPNFWSAAPDSHRLSYDYLETRSDDDGTWAGVLFTGIDHVDFRFWNGSTREWQSDLRDLSKSLSVVQIRLEGSRGSRELTLALGGSSSSSLSGR
jgi:prepilin-type N-terminal cleavage/methylation domain-containing protein